MLATKVISPLTSINDIRNRGSHNSSMADMPEKKVEIRTHSKKLEVEVKIDPIMTLMSNIKTMNSAIADNSSDNINNASKTTVILINSSPKLTWMICMYGLLLPKILNKYCDSS